MTSSASNFLEGRHSKAIDKAVEIMVDAARQRALAELRRSAGNSGATLVAEAVSDPRPVIADEWKSELKQKSKDVDRAWNSILLSIAMLAVAVFQAWCLLGAPPRLVDPSEIGYTRFVGSIATSMVGVAVCWVALGVATWFAVDKVLEIRAYWNGGILRTLQRRIERNSCAIGYTKDTIHFVTDLSEDRSCHERVHPSWDFSLVDLFDDGHGLHLNLVGGNTSMTVRHIDPVKGTVASFRDGLTAIVPPARRGHSSSM